MYETPSGVSPNNLLRKEPLLQRHFIFGFRIEGFEAWISHLRNMDPGKESWVVSEPGTEKKMVMIQDPDGNRIQFSEE